MAFLLILVRATLGQNGLHPIPLNSLATFLLFCIFSSFQIHWIRWNPFTGYISTYCNNFHVARWLLLRDAHLMHANKTDWHSQRQEMMKVQTLSCFIVYWTGRPRQIVSCERKAHNPHSEVPVVGKIDNTVISHIADPLADIDSGTIANITEMIIRPPRSSPDGVINSHWWRNWTTISPSLPLANSCVC